MTTWVFDLDGVLQEPAYPHPRLLEDVSSAINVPYEVLFKHYSTQFSDNEAEEEYHLSLCGRDEQREQVRGFWKKMHENMPKAVIIPGAEDLLQEVTSRGWQIFAWTKGGVEIQLGRLASIGLSGFFPGGHIIASSRKGTIEGVEQDLLPQLPSGKKILVGDSWEQDIEPALREDDILCVWVRWGQEPPEGAALDKPNVVIVESTQELATKIKEGLLDVQDTH